MTSAAPVRLDDPTFYPIEEKVGEDSLQTFTAELFRILVDRWLVTRGKPTFVGADQFIYWMQHHPEKVVAPDVYVLPGVLREASISCLKVWEAGVVPTFALEIVSPGSVEKDYREVPVRYAELGVAELIVFDPRYRKGRDRVRLQVFRRVRGQFVRVAVTSEDRVRSRVLGCWVRSVGRGEHVRLRLGTGERGDALFPTEAEHEHARAEHEHARAEQERARADQAEAEVARMRAEIERMKGGR
jgi:Putative restriction endonuclease